MGDRKKKNLKEDKLRNHLERLAESVTSKSTWSWGYLWIAAKRSSVVRGLLGVITSSLPSSLRKSQASEEAAAVSGSGTPAVETQANTGCTSDLNWHAFARLPGLLPRHSPKRESPGTGCGVLSVSFYYDHNSQSSLFSVEVWNSY